METLSRVTRAEAEIFQKARHLSTDQGYIFKIGKTMSDFLPDEDILLLRSAGLLHDGDFLTVACKGGGYDGHGRYGFGNNGMVVIVAHESKKDFSLPQYLLTPVGRELAGLIDPKPNLDYFAALKEHFASKEGYQLTFLDSKDKEVAIDPRGAK